MQKVAVIGAGTMGAVHSAAYAKMPRAELVAVCDERTEAAQELADRHGCAAFALVDEMLSQVEVDVVDICTPTPTHLELIKKAAAAGKNICCEKPLARTLGQAMEAVRICDDAGVTLFVAHVLRWFPEYVKLRELVCGGAVGKVGMVRMSRCGPKQSGWFADVKQSGGAAMDLIIHDFDWLRWTFGPVERVYAKGLYEAGMPGKDYALVTLRMKNGVIAHVEGSWARPSGFEASVEIAGSDGLLSFSTAKSAPFAIQIESKDDSQVGVIVPESPVSVDPYYCELEHFIDCLEHDRTPDVTAEDGMEAVKTCEAVLRSISGGRPVMLT